MYGLDEGFNFGGIFDVFGGFDVIVDVDCVRVNVSDCFSDVVYV